MKLTVTSKLSKELLGLTATELGSRLEAPTLFDLRRNAEPPLFVSVLLHGNETSGWDAVRRLLATQDAPSLMLFVGNVAAAAAGARVGADGVDFNRIWSDSARVPRFVGELLSIVQTSQPWFALDIHNNTGQNPHYAVMSDTRLDHLQAARAFAEEALIVVEPSTILTRRLAEICPAITIEVGTPGHPGSESRTRAYLRHLFETQAIPKLPTQDLALYRNATRVSVGNAASFSTALAPPSEIVRLRDDLETMNFRSLAAGSVFAHGAHITGGLRAYNEDGIDVTASKFEFVNGLIRLRDSVILAMYTQNLTVARQDCLCYFMESVKH